MLSHLLFTSHIPHNTASPASTLSVNKPMGAAGPASSSWLSEYSKSGKAYVVLAILETLALIFVCAFAIHEAQGKDKQLRFTAILGVYSSIAFLYFAWDSVAKENAFQYISSVLMHVLMFIYVLWHYITESLGEIYKRYSLALLIVVSVFQLFYILLMPGLHSSFGWRLYRRVGASIPLQQMYRTAHMVFALLRIDVAMSGLLFLLASFYLFESNVSTEGSLNIVGMILSVLWVFAARHAIRNESRRLFWICAGFSLIEPTYILYKFAQLNLSSYYRDYPRTTYRQFYIVGSIELAIRLLLGYTGWLAYNNFGKGLAEAVFIPRDSRPLGSEPPPAITSAGAMHQRKDFSTLASDANAASQLLAGRNATNNAPIDKVAREAAEAALGTGYLPPLLSVETAPTDSTRPSNVSPTATNVDAVRVSSRAFSNEFASQPYGMQHQLLSTNRVAPVNSAGSSGGTSAANRSRNAEPVPTSPAPLAGSATVAVQLEHLASEAAAAALGVAPDELAQGHVEAESKAVDPDDPYARLMLESEAETASDSKGALNASSSASQITVEKEAGGKKKKKKGRGAAKPDWEV